MAGLYFTVGADFSKLQKLRKDIDNLKSKLQGMDQAANPKEFAKLEKQLKNLQVEFDREALAAQRAGAMTARAGKEAGAAASDMDKLIGGMKKIGQATGIALTVDKIIDLGREIINVRGEIQQLEIAFETMLGSKEKADAMMANIKKLALSTPFTLTEVADNTKQLIAMGIASEKAIDTVKALGDVAAGVAVPLSRIAINYGQVSALGKLQSREIRDFAMAGIPIVEELGKMLGKTSAEIYDMVETGSIGFTEVEQAFKNMSGEGGKFYNLMEKQNASVTGQMSKLKDSLQLMFNDIGQTSEGIIYGSINITSTLIENYKEIAEILGTVIAAYGTYKAATMLNVAHEKAVQAIRYQEEATALEALMSTEQKAQISKLNLTKGSAEYLAAVRAEIAGQSELMQTKLAEARTDLQALYAKRTAAKETLTLAQAKTTAAKEELAQAIATAQAEIAVKQQKDLATLKETASLTRRNAILLQGQKFQAEQLVMDAKTTGAASTKIKALQLEANAISQKLVATKAEAIQAQKNVVAKEAEIVAGTKAVTSKKIETLTNKVNTLSQKENAVAATHNGLIKQTVAGQIAVKKLATDAETISTNINTATTTANAASTNLLAIAKAKLAAILTRLNSLVLANPYAVTLAAIAAIGYAIYKLATYETEAEKATKKLNEAIAESEKNALSEQRQLAKLKGELAATTKNTKEYDAIKDQIVSKFGQYYNNLGAEIDRVGLLDSTYQSLTNSIRASFAARQYTKFAQEQSDALDTVMADNLKNIQDKLIEELGEEAGAKYLTKIRQALLEGKLTADNGYNIKGLDAETQAALDKASGKGNLIVNRAVEGYIKEVIRAQELTDELDKKAKDRFGIDDSLSDGDGADKEVVKFKTLSDQVKEAKDNVTKFKKELSDLRKGQKPDTVKEGEQFDFAKGIEDKAKQLKDAQDKVSFLTTGKSSSGASQSESAAEKARKQAQKQLDDKLKIDNDKKKADLDARNAELENQEAEIELMEEGFAKEQALQELNHKKSLLAIDKRSRELIEREQEARRKEWDLKNPDGSKNLYRNEVNSMLDLNKKEQEEIEASENIANKRRLKGTEDLLKSMLDKYQDYNAQREAINKKYDADLISLESLAPSEERDRAITELKNQWQKALSSVNLSEFQENIDWSSVFGNLDKLSTETLESVREKISAYLKAAAGNLSKEDIKTVTDAIEQMNSAMANRKPINEFSTGLAEYKEAVADVSKYQAILNNLIADGKGDTQEAKYATKQLTDAQKKRRESLVKLNQAVNSIGAKGTQLVNSGQELTGMLSNLGLEIPEAVEGALSGIGQIMSGLEKVDLTNPMSVITGAVSVISGLGSTVASIFGGGTGREEWEKSSEKYERLMSIMDKVISKQNELLESMAGKEAVEQAAKSEELINKQIEATRALGTEFLNTKRRAGGNRERKFLKEIMRPYADELSKYGIDFNDPYSILYLDPKALEEIRKEMPKFWAEMQGDVSSYLDTIIAYGDELDSLTLKEKEALTGVSFDSLKNSLDDLITSADTIFSDIGDSFEGHMRNAVLNFVKSTYLTSALENWYNKFAEAYSDDVLSESEVTSLRAMYEEAYTKAQNMYDAALGAAGLEKESSSSSQQASKGVYEGMSQETGEKLEARNTGIHMTTISIEGHIITISNSVRNMNEQMIKIGVLTQQSINMMDEIRTIQLNSYYELKDINANTKQLYQMNERLGEMNQKLSQL